MNVIKKEKPCKVSRKALSQIWLMLIPILLWAEMTFGLYRLTTLRADGTSARRNFHAPARQHPHLRARSPKADHRGRFGIFLFGQQFLGENHDAVAVLVISKTDFTNAKEWIDRRVDTHDVFHIITGSFRQFWVLFADLRKELFDANRHGLQLRLLDNHRNRALVLICLKVKHSLTWLADRIGRNMVTRVYINFKTGHKLPSPE